MKLPHNFDSSLQLKYIGRYTSGNFFDIPDLPDQNFSFSPSDDLFPVPFSHKQINHNNILHFYIDDYRFESFWRNPDKYFSKLLIPRYVISPDFSVLPGMPYALQVYNIYRNRLLSLLMIDQGVKLIYNIRWSDPDSYYFCFSGIPKNSVISLSVTSHPDEFFYHGWNFLLENFSPSFILFWGKPSFKVDVPFFVYPYCHFS